MNFSDDNNDKFNGSDIDPIDDLLDILCDLDDDSENINYLAKNGQIIDKSLHETELILETDCNEILESDPTALYPDIEVEIEEQTKEITLEAAVEYEAFLRQTTNPKDQNVVSVAENNGGELEKYQEILDLDTESATSEELVAYVNSLIPLIVQLLQYQINDSQEAIIKGITPILERLIEQRSTEEPTKMAIAISRILPQAISHQIQLSPQEIARAIAPEIALSIREQIRLDENAISEALGSEMGKAIKTQIELERDAMVDALYPVIGSTISKYMVEVVQEINAKVENTLSPEGIKRKIRAKLKGVSEAELILQEAIGCQVQAVFLIHKDSGLIIQEVQKPGEQILDSDMVAGMLTAIRSFANDCIVSGSELDTIDYGAWQIHLEAAGYCYLAVVLQGDPNNRFINKIREIFGEIVLHYGKAIARFTGNREYIPVGVKQGLQQLLNPEDLKPQKTASSPTSLIALLAVILALILIPWGIVNYHARIADRIAKSTATQLDGTPELSVYRLDPTVKKGILTIEGRVPNYDLRQQANSIGQKIAQEHNLEWNNQIKTVDVPINSGAWQEEIARLTQLFNQEPEVQITTNYQEGNLTLTGFILNPERRELIANGYARIPGVKKIILNTQNQLPRLEERVYFESGSNKLEFADNSSKIKSVIQFLHQYPQLHLKLVAYNDARGSARINRELAQQRCLAVHDALLAEGVKPNRLVTDCQNHRLASATNEGTNWSIRYVGFETFLPQQ